MDNLDYKFWLYYDTSEILGPLSVSCGISLKLFNEWDKFIKEYMNYYSNNIGVSGFYLKNRNSNLVRL